MIKINILSLVLMASVTFSSCGGFTKGIMKEVIDGARELILEDESVISHIYTSGNKTIIIVEAPAVASLKKIEATSKKIDEYRAKGYRVVYQSLDIKNSSDTSKRKFRKALGALPTSEMLTKKIRKDGASKFKFVGIDPDLLFYKTPDDIVSKNAKDKVIVISLDEIVAAIEKEKGSILLSDYDRNLAFDKLYPKDKIFFNKENKPNIGNKSKEQAIIELAKIKSAKICFLSSINPENFIKAYNSKNGTHFVFKEKVGENK